MRKPVSGEEKSEARSASQGREGGNPRLVSLLYRPLDWGTVMVFIHLFYTDDRAAARDRRHARRVGGSSWDFVASQPFDELTSVELVPVIYDRLVRNLRSLGVYLSLQSLSSAAAHRPSSGARDSSWTNGPSSAAPRKCKMRCVNDDMAACLAADGSSGPAPPDAGVLFLDPPGYKGEPDMRLRSFAKEARGTRIGHGDDGDNVGRRSAASGTSRQRERLFRRSRPQRQ